MWADEYYKPPTKFVLKFWWVKCFVSLLALIVIKQSRVSTLPFHLNMLASDSRKTEKPIADTTVIPFKKFAQTKAIYFIKLTLLMVQ